jgi:hypothetical protein
MRKTCPALLLLIVCICVPWHRVSAEEEWKMEINLSKEVYLEDEPVWLDCWLTNVSDDTLRTRGLCLQCYWCPELLLMDTEGDTLPYTGPHQEVVHRPGTTPGFILGPGKSDYDCYDLVESFHQRPCLFSFYQATLDPGEYRVKARCGTAESKELEFEVKPPEGGEARAHQLLKDALNFFISKDDSMEHHRLNELLVKYPRSVYAQIACRHLSRWEQILEGYPNSGCAENAIRSLTAETSGISESEKKKFYRRIIEEHPKTRAAWFAERKLSAIRRQN